jgi:hypothetical protein
LTPTTKTTATTSGTVPTASTQLTAKVVRLSTDEYEEVRSDLRNRQPVIKEHALPNGTLLAHMLKRREESKQQHQDKAEGSLPQS